MRISTLFAGLLVLCVSVALAAPGDVTPGAATTTIPGGVTIARPDLVVKQVEISRGAGEFPMYTFKITVANVGTLAAAASKTGLISYTLFNTTQPMAAGLVGEVDTPAIPAGGQTVVSIVTDRISAQMFLFACADFPVSTHTLGAVAEKSEVNNAMTVPLNTAGTFPRVFK